MVVADEEMERFIRAVTNSTTIDYLTPGEINPSMLGKKVRLCGGPLDGLEVTLLKIRGVHRRRALVEIPDLIASVIEIDLSQ